MAIFAGLSTLSRQIRRFYRLRGLNRLILVTSLYLEVTISGFRDYGFKV